MVEHDSQELAVMVQCELLSLNRSGVYYRPQAVAEQKLQIKRRIDEIYTAWPFYGVRKLTAQLRLDGLVVNHKAVARHMREMDLVPVMNYKTKAMR